MACALSKSLSISSPLKKQGIVTVLSGDFDCDISSNNLAASLRRTFSADISSRNWISPNGFRPMKRISSSDELQASVDDRITLSDEEGGGGEEEEESRSGFDIWNQIQEEKNRINYDQIDIWSSILSQKTDYSKSLPSPYVHPLVKQSSSSLSDKSLEICTESLGSETGSDGFPVYRSSETRDSEEEKEKSRKEEPQKVVEAKEEQPKAEQETRIENYGKNLTICRKLTRGSFPPPIPSLLSETGKSLQMKTCRNDGRLLLEVVSVPSQNNLCATRQDGRLVLTIAKSGIDSKSETYGEERESDLSSFEEEEEEEEKEEEKEMEFEMEEEQKPSNVLEIGPGKTNALVSVHRLAHKSINLPNRKPGWPTKDNKEKDKREPSVPIAQSLPPKPRVAHLARAVQPQSTVDDTIGAACFNAYEYYWKLTESDKEVLGPNKKAQFQAQKLYHKKHGGGGGDAWLGCMERKRSLLLFEPFCIAT